MLINIARQAIIASYFLLFLATSFAEEVLPSGCEAVVIKHDTVTIPAGKYVYLFLHNLSKNDIWLVPQVQSEDLQPDWSTKMIAGTWSAWVLNKQAQVIEFSCIESNPGHEQRTSCQDVLAICSWPGAKIPEDKKGEFFVAESLDLSSLTAYSERNGYSLK